MRYDVLDAWSFGDSTVQSPVIVVTFAGRPVMRWGGRLPCSRYCIDDNSTENLWSAFCNLKHFATLMQRMVVMQRDVGDILVNPKSIKNMHTRMHMRMHACSLTAEHNTTQHNTTDHKCTTPHDTPPYHMTRHHTAWHKHTHACTKLCLF